MRNTIDRLSRAFLRYNDRVQQADTVSHHNIELNDQFKQALELMENSRRHLFITGKAGTGKSTLLSYFRASTAKRLAVLAPTGVAALNVKGQTIHSFFRFKTDITPDTVKRVKNGKLYRELDCLIIDEISMVRADLLDCVDRFLRLNGPDSKQAFGGVQMIFIGDLYQLPPVVTTNERHVFESYYDSPYFFSARVLADIDMTLIELEKIYRQKDAEFIRLLNGIRTNTLEDVDLAELNQRVDTVFQPAEKEFFITLTTTNAMADDINERQLDRLRGRGATYEAQVGGEFDRSSYPTQTYLSIKPGAQVMLLNNDSAKRWVNGSLGQVAKILRDDDDGDIVVVRLTDGKTVEVEPYTWELTAMRYNDSTERLEADTIGTFTQYPLRLAWAVTIHRSQGKTFDRVIIDLGRGTFAHGQTYVALSRCTALDGLVLRQPLKTQYIRTDRRVIEFVTRYQYKQAEVAWPLEAKVERLRQAIESHGELAITYLKARDEKSRRTISPLKLGEMEYGGKRFLGVTAFCHTRQEERVFRVDRILAIDN